MTISLELIVNGARVLSHYSVVYDLVTGDVQIVTDRNYQQVYHYQLSMR